VIVWANIQLCTDGDVAGYESSWPAQWTTDSDSWRAQAKIEIEDRLRHLFRERELVTEAPDVLDLVDNPAVLASAAACMTLHLCAKSNTINPPGDVWAYNAKFYEDKFNDEWERAADMIAFDADESGTIEESEKYQVNTGVRFGRGG